MEPIKLKKEAVLENSKSPNNIEGKQGKNVDEGYIHIPFPTKQKTFWMLSIIKMAAFSSRYAFLVAPYDPARAWT